MERNGLSKRTNDVHNDPGNVKMSPPQSPIKAQNNLENINNEEFVNANYYNDIDVDFKPSDILSVLQDVQAKTLLKDAQNALTQQTRGETLMNVATAVNNALPGIISATKTIAESPYVNYAGSLANPIRSVASGVTVVGSATAVGVGLPVVIVCATVLAKVAKMYRDKAQLNILVNTHFNKLIFIIKNFTVIEQTLKYVEFDYYNISKQKSGENLAPIALNVKLNDTFKEAVLKYTTLLHAQLHLEETSSASGRFWYALRYVTDTVSDAYQTLINDFTKLFHEIETQYFLEVARFTTLIFFNFDNFNRLSKRLKLMSPYYKFALANIISTPIPCIPVEGDPTRCLMDAADLETQYSDNMKALNDITSEGDRHTASLIENKLDAPDILAIVKQSGVELKADLKVAEDKAGETTKEILRMAIQEQRANNANKGGGYVKTKNNKKLYRRTRRRNYK